MCIQGTQTSVIIACEGLAAYAEFASPRSQSSLSKGHPAPSSVVALAFGHRIQSAVIDGDGAVVVCVAVVVAGGAGGQLVVAGCVK
jgi:hypothetical protein